MASKSVIDECKAYAIVEHGDDDALIGSLADAAEEYLRGAGIQRTADNEQRYMLALKSMVAFWYDNRESGADTTTLPAVARTLVNQLKLEAL